MSAARSNAGGARRAAAAGPPIDFARLQVSTPQGAAGVLAREARYVFACDARATAAKAVSLTMPPRLQPYAEPQLHPVFQMNLPEGFLLERLRNLLAKSTGSEPMVLLALLGAEHAIGRLRFALPQAPPRPPDAPGETLARLLAYRGAEGLFESLVDRYLLRSGLSGVQPKVLVPERASHKASAVTAGLIVKSGLEAFPGLAINEFVCMSAARGAGIPVPEFFLSDDRRLFVMRRFDRGPAGEPLGFEDMAALSGKDASRKYAGRYEDIARLIGLYCSDEHQRASLAQLFDTVALSCIVGNGDAHLKNFGVLYDEPAQAPVRLAPAYDIVNTTCYLEDDALALQLGPHRSFFAARQGLLDFAPRCGLPAARAKQRIGELCDAVKAVLREHRSLAAEVPGLAARLDEGVKAFRRVQRA